MQAHQFGLVIVLGIVNIIATSENRYSLELGITISTHVWAQANCKDDSFTVQFKGDKGDSEIHPLPKRVTNANFGTLNIQHFHGTKSLGRLKLLVFKQVGCKDGIGIAEIYIANLISGEFYGRKYLLSEGVYVDDNEIDGKTVEMFLYELTNLALNRPTGTKGKLYKSSTETGFAVDSETRCNDLKVSITVPSGSMRANWHATLYQAYDIWGINIYPQRCCFMTLKNVEVQIGVNLKSLKTCGHFKGPASGFGPSPISCRGHASIVFIQTSQRRLSMCEVQIYGKPESLAFKKPTGTLGNLFNSESYLPKFAVDGTHHCVSINRDTKQGTITIPKGKKPADWYVDLGKEFYVTDILIQARRTEALRNVIIKIGPSLKKLKKCARYAGPSKTFEMVKIDCQGSARFVYIEKENTKKDLHLCEVEVFNNKVAQWSKWSAMSSCSSTCVQDGQSLMRARHRKCSSHNGGTCIGSDADMDNIESVISACASKLCDKSLVPVIKRKPECLGEKKDGKHYFYEGTKSVTKSGKKCQRWDAATPHVPDIDIQKINMGARIKMENYCRTPAYGSSMIPWCYTTDPNKPWEHCDIRDCEMHKECLGEKRDKIHYFYDGTKSVTKSGKKCQRWDGHLLNKDVSKMNMDIRKQMRNYCRTLETDERAVPWCFTTDPNTPLEECDILMC